LYIRLNGLTKNVRQEVGLVKSVWFCLQHEGHHLSSEKQTFLFVSSSATESTQAIGLINVLTPDVKRLLPSCLTSRSVHGHSHHTTYYNDHCPWAPRWTNRSSAFTADVRINSPRLCLFPNSLTRGSTTKTSRINVLTATVPTPTRHRCRSICQRTPSKTLKPTAVACVAGRTPQWVNRMSSGCCYMCVGFFQSAFRRTEKTTATMSLRSFLLVIFNNSTCSCS